MQLLESGEMYLETILILSEQQPFVRSVDVANYTGYSKPSVSRAVNLLKDNGYIAIDDFGYITLKEPGRSVASRIYQRHRMLTEFLKLLGVSPDVAEEDACKIEHDISDESFARICEHVERYRGKK